jgi:hypothetical protein
MATSSTGLEEIGLGSTQANSLYNANLQRLYSWLFPTHFLFPVPANGATSSGDIHPAARVVLFVLIRCDDAANLPSGTSLLVQLNVNGNLLGQQYALPAGQSEALVAVTGDGNGNANPFDTLASDPFSGPGVLVPATQTLKAKINTAANALNVTVTPLWRIRVV